VGEYVDDPLISRGFLRDKHGRFTRLDVPRARSSQAIGINDRGQVVGEYKDAAGKFHGYLWDKGRFTTFAAPGVPLTFPFGLNDRSALTSGGLPAAGRLTDLGSDSDRSNDATRASIRLPVCFRPSATASP
jgi:probable HAF family extracellular repeat protein